MRRESLSGLGVFGLGLAAYRNIAIVITRRYLTERNAFTKDEEDEDGDLNEDEIVNLQAGHGSHVAGMMYARGVREKDGAVESRRKRFRKASEAWHSLLGFAAGDGAEEVVGRKRARAPFEEVAGESRLARGKRLRGADLEGELQALMGEGSRFRGPQKAALEAIMHGESRVLVVMGTGGGKSLIFMLPTWCGSGGTTIVVVPLIALREDLKSRCEALGISCQEWDSRRPLNGSRIVFVTPEAALSPSFASFINRLKGVH
ncbi:hypothetical protein MMC17_002670 [Xylographa soralifera]|nr:hypothetical protein [Xylographa soralifera]